MKSNGRILESKGKRKELGSNFAGDTSSSTQPPSEAGYRLSSSNYDFLSPSKRVRRETPTSIAQSLPETTSKTHSLAMATESMYTFSAPHKLFSNATASTSSRSTLKGAASQSSSGNHIATRSGPGKLVVKHLRTTPKISAEDYFAKIWAKLDVSLTAIFNDQELPCSLEELYKGAENVCRQGNAPKLNKNLRSKCKENVISNIKERLSTMSSRLQDKCLVQEFVESWPAWDKKLNTIRNIFYYMDQSYLLRSAEKSVKEMGLGLFRSYVFHDEELKSKILCGIQDLINADRKEDRDATNSPKLRRLVHTLHDLGVYTDDFEPSLQDATAVYLKHQTSDELSNNDLAKFLEQCTRLLDQEMNRCEAYDLDRTTRKMLSDLFDRIVIEEHIDFVLDTDALLDLYKSNNSKALGQAYRFLDRVGKASELRSSFDTYITGDGSSIVFDEEREAEMVPRLLDLKKRLDHIQRSSFNENDDLANTLHKAFDNFINRTKRTQANWGTDNPKPGEMIAKYVDALLKGGIKAMPSLAKTAKIEPPKAVDDYDDDMVDEEDEINRQLDLALDLFRFVHGKAVFEAFYKKDLARRLLMGRSASDDAERSMLARLKTECGAGFTHNLESMFKDMDLAREEMSSYTSLLAERGVKPELDLSASVLSSAAWPTYPDPPVNIPMSISKAMHNFETHYKAKYQGRKLTWKHALSHCQLRARFPRGNKEIVVSGFQAIVLLLFNKVEDGSNIAYQDIQASTGLTDAELTRTLQSLACAKYRVLTKTPKGREVNSTDQFSYNANFHDQKMRIKINQVQLKETKEENKETHHRIAADRHYETQAAIVRIMKSRKTVKHVELVTEVINATKNRGPLDPADIKKNIEKLIEKDYMDREAGNTYVYLA